MEKPFRPKPRKLSLCQGIVLMESIALVLFLALEVGCRLAGYDFDHRAERFERTPPFLREPTIPVGEAFFRKPGPAQWHGKVLYSMFVELGYSGEPPPAEEDPEVFHEYDAQGFRNPPGLADWEIAIAGDSFTELATVSQEDLFTTRLGKQLGVRVKNLGVAVTGTLTQTCYLQEFGKAPSTKHAMVVFFEGNDLDDLVAENNQVWKARTGHKEDRSLENLPKQTSLLKALYKACQPSPPKKLLYNAYYEFDGRRVPIRIAYAPPGSAGLSSGVRAMLVESLRGWAATANRLNLKPWLVFMPCKARVFHHYLKFMDHAPRNMADWTPNDLPEFIQSICGDAGITFIDVTPRLRVETAKGHLTYPTSDTHLNTLGSICVAEVLAAALNKDSQHSPSN
jgi:hypothetical protein